MTHHILFNPYSGNGTGKHAAEEAAAMIPSSEVQLHDMTEIKDYAVLFSAIGAEEKLILCGGDGTLNRFVNETATLKLDRPIFFYAAGTGNDFLRDIPLKEGEMFPEISRYLKNLPKVEVFGVEYYFLNGVGYGIDGYCCEVADKLKESSDKPINYTAIAIKGLLFHFKPVTATVTVDGVTHVYRKAWLAPTMNGRFYGGGMMPTPEQNRLNEAHTVSTMVMHGKGKLQTLMVFPTIFKGEHVKHTEMCEVLSGHDITVEFDRPCALQIDGETILGVSRCHITGA